MGLLETNPYVAAIPRDMTPLEAGFEPGKYYEQVDLGSRAAVEGLAYSIKQRWQDRKLSDLTTRIANRIEWANSSLPGEYVVFTGKDQFESEVAYVYKQTGKHSG